MKETTSLNDLIASVYASADHVVDMNGKRSIKLIINTIDTTDMTDEVMQAICVVPSYEDIAMFIHEVEEDSSLVDASFRTNTNAVNLIIEYLRHTLNTDIVVLSGIDEDYPPDNCLVLTRIEIVDKLIILDLL